MKKMIMWCVLLWSSQVCLALEPYVQGDKLAGADLSAQLAQIEKKLQAEGFTVIGRHTPKGLPGPRRRGVGYTQHWKPVGAMCALIWTVGNFTG